MPDGQPFDRRILYVVTPRAANFAPAEALFINEWMAANTHTLADPADLAFDDWFELYNAGPTAVDLSGYYLADQLSDPTQFIIPNGYTIPPGGFLLVWADQSPNQNSSNRVDLHVNFRLASGGEAVGLFSPSGGAIDQVTFGAQTNDVSQVRFADGAATLAFMATPTPGGPNIVGSGNTPPQLAVITDRTVTLGQTLSFIVSATDAESPPQTLNFSLPGAVPSGANVVGGSGLFTWTPLATQTPSTNYLTVRVTDNDVPPLSAERSFIVFVVAAPRISGITPAPGGVVSLTLQTITGKTYRLEYKNQLNDAAWSPLGPDRLATSGSLTIEDNFGPNPQRFYRVVS